MVRYKAVEPLRGRLLPVVIYRGQITGISEIVGDRCGEVTGRDAIIQCY